MCMSPKATSYAPIRYSKRTIEYSTNLISYEHAIERLKERNTNIEDSINTYMDSHCSYDTWSEFIDWLNYKDLELCRVIAEDVSSYKKIYYRKRKIANHPELKNNQ